jgi:glycerol kinase
VRWLEDLGLVRSATELDSLAATDTEGVLCVPAFAGLAAPWWAPDATASFTGMTLATRREHLVGAMLQGIAAQVAGLCTLVASDIGRPLSRLRVDGGLTNSAALMQAQADIAQIPVDVYPHGHATPLGAAALARCALDPALSLEEAVGDWQPTTVYEPRWLRERAEEFRTAWAAAAAAAKGDPA